MPAHNPHDESFAAAARAAQADPLAMYLVIRREAPASFAELAAATGQAVVRCARQYAQHPPHAAAFGEWYAASYRKVTLRANERDWARLLTDYDLALGGSDNGSLVAALPPIRKSARDRFITGLQAYTTNIADLPSHPAAPIARPALALLLNPAMSMSAGKALAQLGHGALMAADRWAMQDPAGEAAWIARGAGVILLEGGVADWERIRVEDEASLVVDGGLTEIASGSETVLALPLH